MGSHPYFYFTKYQSDVNSALQSLRQQEFEAGRYFPAMRIMNFIFPPTARSAAPGAQHSSIESAIEDADADGTGSILDIQKISDTPAFLSSWILSVDEIQALFNTDKPTRQMVEDIIAERELEHWKGTGYDVWEEFWEIIGRGESRYILLYENDQPSEIFFIGYSID